MPAAPIITAVAAIYSAVSQSQQAKKAASQQQQAMQQSQANADKAAAKADEDFNRANQKKADTNAALSAAQDSVKGGTAGTMLTGPQGVDPAAMSLGKTTLLGG